MSEKSKYDKILLTTGIIIGVGAGIVGALGFLSLEDLYKAPNNVTYKKPAQPTGITEAKIVSEAISANHDLVAPKHESQEFVPWSAPYLWLKSNTTEPIDVRAAGSTPIHPPIPNEWFFEHGLEDIFVYSDVLTRDPDNDGFTILEEFEAKTLPNNPDSHPALITKLQMDEIKQSGMTLQFSSDNAPEYTFKAFNPRGQEIWKNTIKVDEDFGKIKGSKTPDRFKLVKVEVKKFHNESMDITEEEPEAVVEDLSPNKKGTTYTIRKGTRYGERIIDRTVTFTVSAGKNAGTTFDVKEGAQFKIPGDDKTTFTLKQVDNKTQTATITNDQTGQSINLKKQKN